MAMEINWERLGYESRVDARAEEIEMFVTAVLGTIDVESARCSTRHWEIVCRYFAGCTGAARAQGATPEGGGKRIAAYLSENFPCNSEGSGEGFFEFMDWLANPGGFRPVALRGLLQRA